MDRAVDLAKEIVILAMMDESDIPLGFQIARREAIVKVAVQAADDIVMEFSDGSKEETDYLTHEVCMEWVMKAVGTHRSAMLAKDLTERQKG